MPTNLDRSIPRYPNPDQIFQKMKSTYEMHIEPYSAKYMIEKYATKEETEMKNIRSIRLEKTKAYLAIRAQQNLVERLELDLWEAKACMNHMPDMTTEEIGGIADLMANIAIRLENEVNGLREMMQNYQGGNLSDPIKVPDFLLVDEEPKAAKKKSNG